MRINEITASNIKAGVLNTLSAAGAIAQQFGSVIADKIIQSNLSGASSTTDNNPYAVGSIAQLKSMVGQNAKIQSNYWIQTITDVMKNEGVTSTQNLTSLSKQLLGNALLKNLHTNFLLRQLGNDYKKLPNLVNNEAKAKANEVVNDITVSLQRLTNFNNELTRQQQLVVWENLLSACYQAIELKLTQPLTAPVQGATAPKGPITIGGQTLDPNNPRDLKLINDLQQAMRGGR
jgi:hypothetical protein